MALQTINIGTMPNDGNGDTLRTAFDKINDNFSELEQSTIISSQVATASSTGNVVIFSANASSFTQGIFQINSIQMIGNVSSFVYGNNSQNVTLNVAKLTNGNIVNHTAYSTLIIGNAIINAYNVDIANVSSISNVYEGNVVISVSPDSANLGVNYNMLHLIQYRTL